MVAHHINLLNLVWQQKGLKMRPHAHQCTAQLHITTPTRSIPEAPEIRIPPYYRQTAVMPMVSALEGFNCTTLKEQLQNKKIGGSKVKNGSNISYHAEQLHNELTESHHLH